MTIVMLFRDMADASMTHVQVNGTGNLFGKFGVWMMPRAAVNVVEQSLEDVDEAELPPDSEGALKADMKFKDDVAAAAAAAFADDNGGNDSDDDDHNPSAMDSDDVE